MGEVVWVQVSRLLVETRISYPIGIHIPRAIREKYGQNHVLSFLSC